MLLQAIVVSSIERMTLKSNHATLIGSFARSMRQRLGARAKPLEAGFC
jgi:hypothetical protein